MHDTKQNIHQTIEALRSVAPSLDSAAFEAGKTIQDVNAFLGDIHFGVSVCGPSFVNPDADQDGERTPGTCSCLAYGRVAGKYCLHVLTGVERVHQTQEGPKAPIVLIESRVPWFDCSREVRLRSYATLPVLLERIAMESDRLVPIADQAMRVTQDFKRFINEYGGGTG